MNEKSINSLDSKPYRVAIVVPNLAHGGGVTTVADFLFSTVDQSEQFSVDLFSLATSSSDRASLRILDPRTWRNSAQTYESSWKDRPFLHVGAIGTEFEFARYLPRKLLTEKLNQYDIVQVVCGIPAWGYAVRDVKSPVFLQVATLAKVERRRKLATETGPRRWLSKAMTALTARIERQALNSVNIVFVENSWMFDFVSSQIGPSKTIFAPPGVDTSIFTPAETRSSSSPYILSVGRFGDPRKNITLLFEAYARFRSSAANPPRLVLAGSSGPSTSDWNVAERLGIRGHIDFYKGLELDELAQLYREAEFFVLTSDEEGLGMVVLEAMSSGLPAISTRSGGPDGIISEGVDGHLVPLGDPVALSEALAKMHQSGSQREQMSIAARQKVEEQFSLGVAGERYITAYLNQLQDEG